MYQNYKVVVNTAAGRRRYMQYLVPPILNADIVDRYDIWVNTHNMVDIEFFKELAVKYPKINLVWQPDGVVNGIASINAFYRDCCDENTIYMKLDDDVVWFEPELFEKMVKFRIDNPEYFLVSPLVINNALSTYLLQVHNKIKLDKYYMSICMERTISLDGWFAADLHNWFMDNYLKTGTYSKLYVGKHPIGMARFSINCVLWFGQEMAKFKGEVPGDDEEYLSCIKPTQLGMCNCFNGNALIAHFAFGTQRKGLDKMDILNRYGKILHELWQHNEAMREIEHTIQDIIKDIESRSVELTALPSPYKKVSKKKESFVICLFKKLPQNVRLAIHELLYKQRYKFIER
ncbi:hypothetical protein [Phocaeicola sp.]